MKEQTKQEMSDIIKRIKNRKDELGYSYQDFADKTGLSKSTLQRYITGSIKNLPLDKLKSIAAALETTPEYLMGWNDTEMESNADDFRFQHLYQCYEQLNDIGKTEAKRRIEELTHIPRYQRAGRDEEDLEQYAPYLDITAARNGNKEMSRIDKLKMIKYALEYNEQKLNEKNNVKDD